MRSTSLAALALLAWLPACVAEAPPPTFVVAVPAPSAVAASTAAPVAAAPPPEPEGLVAVARGAGECSIDGRLDGRGVVELAPRPVARPIVAVTEGVGTLRVAADGSGSWEVKTPAATLHGYAELHAEVYPRRWVAFGGVRFAAARERLTVSEARGGRVVVDVPSTRRVALREPYRTASVACADLAIAPDASGEIGRALPPPAEASGAVDVRLVRSGPNHAPVPVRAEPGGPVVADFVQEQPDERVALLETKGGFGRVRAGHFADWLPTASLAPLPKAPKSASSARAEALREAAEFGMLGLLATGDGGTPDPAGPKRAPPRTRRVRCEGEARLVVETAGTAGPRERFVVGALAARTPITVVEGDSDLAYLAAAPAGVDTRDGARLATPARDLVGCAPDDTEAHAAPDLAATEPPPDAFDALASAWDAAPPRPLFGVAIGEAFGAGIGDSFGAGGLGLSGVGAGAGGAGVGTIGLGSIGRLGHGGSAAQRVGGAKKPPKIQQGATTVNGRLPPEVIQRIVRQSFGRLRTCYEQGLARDAALAGRVAVRFVVDRAGAVSTAQDFGSTLADKAVVACVVQSFQTLAFPQPEGGIVTVVYPIDFAAP